MGIVLILACCYAFENRFLKPLSQRFDILNVTSSAHLAQQERYKSASTLSFKDKAGYLRPGFVIAD
jgi:hypothetical protein